MPKIYLLKKTNPDDTIWKHYPEDDFVRWVGENEEEARKNAARGSLPKNKAMSMSPWLNKEQTSRELECSLRKGRCRWSERLAER